MTNSLLTLFKNPYALGYLGLYTIFLVLLQTVAGFDIREPVFVLLIFGVGFTSLAWWTTRKTIPLSFSVKSPALEVVGLAIYYLFITAYLSWGADIVNDASRSEPLRSIIIWLAKIIVFVLVPFLLLQWRWDYNAKDFVRNVFSWQQFNGIILILSAVLILFQVFFGQGLSAVQRAQLGGWKLAAGIPFAFSWLILEVGLVEEFFFRVLVQSRIAAWLKSEIAGIVLTSLLFGLAHAPGLYFRTAQTQELLIASPSLLMAIGYSIVVTSVAGFFFGVLWIRTRSLMALMIVHAANDLVPNMLSIIKAWLP